MQPVVAIPQAPAVLTNLGRWVGLEQAVRSTEDTPYLVRIACNGTSRHTAKRATWEYSHVKGLPAVPSVVMSSFGSAIPCQGSGLGPTHLEKRVRDR